MALWYPHREMSRRSRSGLLWAAVAATTACRPAEWLARPPQLQTPGQSSSKCTMDAQQSSLMVVDWEAADRASLEVRLARGPVALHVQGCNLRILRYCKVPGEYKYQGLTRKNNRVKIRNTDELYAQLPIGAAHLEAKLMSKGALDVEIALVGMLTAPGERPRRDTLSGECESATHVITGVQIGAFKLTAGGSGELRAGGGIGQIGAGAGSKTERENLSEDGQPENCDAATSADLRAPEGCGALVRLELAAVDSTVAAPPVRELDGASWTRPQPTIRPPRSGLSKAYLKALAQYDNLELDAALQGLDAALKEAGEADPTTAPLHVLRAVIFFAWGRTSETTAAFVNAVRADYNIVLPPQLRSPDLQRLLDQARRDSGLDPPARP